MISAWTSKCQRSGPPNPVSFSLFRPPDWIGIGILDVSFVIMRQLRHTARSSDSSIQTLLLLLLLLLTSWSFSIISSADGTACRSKYVNTLTTQRDQWSILYLYNIVLRYWDIDILNWCGDLRERSLCCRNMDKWWDRNGTSENGKVKTYPNMFVNYTRISKIEWRGGRGGGRWY